MTCTPKGAAMSLGDFAEFVICALRQMCSNEVIITEKELVASREQW